MAPYETPKVWHCFAAMNALRMYPRAKSGWKLPDAGEAYLPNNSNGTWHVTSLCPSAMWSSTKGALVAVEDALLHLCHHCQMLLTTSEGVASLRSDQAWWDASPIAEALLVSLLFILSHPESRAAYSVFGRITQEARNTAATAVDRQLSTPSALMVALQKSSQHRHSLLQDAGVLVSPEAETSLFAPVFSVPGGHLLLSDKSRVLGGNVLLTQASYKPVFEREPTKMRTLPFADRETVELFGALSATGLDVQAASQAALLLTN